MSLAHIVKNLLTCATLKNKVNLKIDWASHEAALYACKNWHYSQCLPIGKLVKVGVWEDGKYIGCIIYSRGTALHLGTAYGLTQTECVELTRVALKAHKSPVSRMLALSLKFLKQSNPNLRLVVSFAAKSQNHHGGIYQAANWIYAGETGLTMEATYKGKRLTSRTLHQMARNSPYTLGQMIKMGWLQDVVELSKYRYLMPLDSEMRAKVLPLSKPYPKRVGGVGSDTPAIHAGEGGASPTSTLHINELQK